MESSILCIDRWIHRCIYRHMSKRIKIRNHRARIRKITFFVIFLQVLNLERIFCISSKGQVLSTEAKMAKINIDQNLIDEFEKNGVVCLRGVFDQKWIDIVRQGIEKIMLSPSSYSERVKGSKLDGIFFYDYYNWGRIEEFKKFAFESPAAAIAGTLTQSKEMGFYHESVLVKEPGTDRLSPWHHDQSYYPIDGEKVCSIWMPVDPIPREVCVQFVAGSHKWGWYQPIWFKNEQPLDVIDEKLNEEQTYKKIPDIDANRDQYDILYWDLQPGDCIVFHMKLLHGAPGNLSTERRRRVIATRWIGDDTVIARRPWKPSPSTTGGLQVGERAISDEFPIVWRRED